MKTSLVLGFFDGVHTAHRAVLSSAVKFAAQEDIPQIVLVTFKNSPSLYFLGNSEYIFKREHSYSLIKELGITDIVELNFEDFVAMSADEYLKFLFERYKPVSISAGYNHTFGKNKSGGMETLKHYQEKYKYKYLCVPEQVKNGKIISSTLIKDYLKKGCIEEANELLESEFFIEGRVIMGKRIGRSIGYPTANIKYPNGIVKISYGVYKVKLNIKDKVYDGVMNWGIKPTLSEVNEPCAEIHIMDFNGDLYDKNIKVNILNKIRDEKKFNNLTELKSQIEKDIRKCLEL